MSYKDQPCHRCGERIGDTEVPVAVYIVAGPATRFNSTPEEVLALYGDRLSPVIRALLDKMQARGVYCGLCASFLTSDFPAEEVERLEKYAEQENPERAKKRKEAKQREAEREDR